MLPPEVASALDEVFSSEPTEPEVPKPQEQMEPVSFEPSGKKAFSKTKQRSRPVSDETEHRSSEGVNTPSIFFIGAGIPMGLGSPAGIRFGFSAWARYGAPSDWPVGLSGTLWFPVQEAIEGTKEGQKTIYLIHGGPFICPLGWRWQALSSLSCIGLQMGTIRVRTEGLVDNDKVTKAIVDLTVAAHLKVSLFEHLYPTLEIAATLPFIQHRFQYTDSVGVAENELFYMAQFGLMVKGGLEFSF